MDQSTIILDEDSQEYLENNGNISERRKRPILVLINPHSGRGKSVLIYRKELIPFFQAHNIEIETFVTQSESRVHDFLFNKSLDELQKFRSIVVVSGDGLVHEVLNAIMAREDWREAIKIPIGIIPTGSGNGLAYTLIRQRHPQVQDLNEAIRICLKQAIQDKTCQSDLVKLTYGRDEKKIVWSFLSIGWGLMADIDIDSEWLRSFGELRFTIYGLLRSVTSVSYKGRLSYKLIEHSDDNKCEGQGWTHIEDKFACLYAVHQSYISSVTKFAPQSTLTDQVIYLTYITGKLSLCRVIEFLLSIKDGSQDKLPYVTVVPISQFHFQPLEASKVVVDGEVISWTVEDGPLEAQIVPKTMNLSWGSHPSH